MATWQELIRKLHESPVRLVISVTGGGSLAVSDLLTEPGASATVLEARVPYSSPALADWIGRSPESSCSRDTALAMASAAWWRARQLCSNDESRADGMCLGVACTAALVSGRPKRGDHRCRVAVESDNRSSVYSLDLSKGSRDRVGEESIVRSVILRAIAEAAEIGTGPLLDLVGDETLVVETEKLPAEIVEVRKGERDFVWSLPEGSVAEELPAEDFSEPVAGLLPGSFNPLHSGHEELRLAAERILEGRVLFELSILNADKPPLDCFSLEQRRHTIPNVPVAITAAPRFIEKACLFPGMTFVIGFDTAVRIIDPRFYEGSAERLSAALSEIRDADCRFLVAGRREGERFRDLSQISLPRGYEELFTAIPESVFREDVSSTELRNGSRGNAAS